MPLSVLSAMREAGRHKITVKGGKFLERLSQADTVIFDKTGTLTRACPTVSQIIAFNGRDERELLHGAGIGKTVMLTGDSRNTAAAVAQKLRIDDYHAEVLPEDKAQYIRDEQAQGRTVVMIGDGINDAPALSLADVGIAIGSGATIAREVADITIAAEDLRELVLLRRLSERLMRRIGRNYRFVMSFNGALILFGALGLLPPATSALLHNGSTLLLSMDCLSDLLPE